MLFAILSLALSADTVTIDGARIRIANIDAPELHHAQCDTQRRLAVVARVRLHGLLDAGTIVVHPGDPLDGRLKDRSAARWRPSRSTGRTSGRY